MKIKNIRLRPMSRNEYDKFVKTIPANICLFCKYKKYQIIIHEWKYWILVQSISPYFTFHSMLCTKRHIKYFSELNNNERLEFWKSDKEINYAYNMAGIKKIRMQLHIRYTNNKNTGPNEHFHMHYYQFKDGDFKILLSKTAYKQDMVKILGRFF